MLKSKIPYQHFLDSIDATVRLLISFFRNVCIFSIIGLGTSSQLPQPLSLGLLLTKLKFISNVIGNIFVAELAYAVLITQCETKKPKNSKGT